MGNRKRGRMPYTIRIYKPRETFRMHIRVERWPTVDFRRGRELTFALPLCANSHKDSLSLSLPSPLFLLPPPSSPRPRRTTVCFLREFQLRPTLSTFVFIDNLISSFLICIRSNKGIRVETRERRSLLRALRKIAIV